MEAFKEKDRERESLLQKKVSDKRRKIFSMIDLNLDERIWRIRKTNEKNFNRY